MTFISDFSLLVFHSLLTLILIFDKKDMSTILLLIVETITLPIHLYLYVHRDLKDLTFHHRMMKTFRPLFITCITFCALRYLLLFFRYTIVKNMINDYILNMFTRTGDVQNAYKGYTYYSFFYIDDLLRDDDAPPKKQLLAFFSLEFYVLVLCALVYTTIKHNMKTEDKAKALKVGVSLINNFTNVDNKKKLKIISENERRRKKYKAKRTYFFLIFIWIAQGFTVMFSTTALTTSPNFFKCAIMVIYMGYLFVIFSQLRRVLVKYRIFKNIKTLIAYFSTTFVGELKTRKEYTFEVTPEIEETEAMQNTLFYHKILYEAEKVVELLDKQFWWILVMPLVFQNLINFSIFVFFKLQRLVHGYQIPELKPTVGSGGHPEVWIQPGSEVFNFWLGYKVYDQTTLDTDIYHTQILACLLLVVFGISRRYYIKKKLRMEPIGDKLTKALMDCITARLDLYSYKPPKQGPSELKQKSDLYLKKMARFDRFLKGIEDGHPNDEKPSILSVKDLSSSSSSSSSSPPASADVTESGSSNLNSSYDEYHTDNIIEYRLSERTDITDKLLFVHHNKYKLYMVKIITAGLYNINRLALMWIAYNIIKSASYFNFLLLAACVYRTRKPVHIVIEKGFVFYIWFCGYFICNWVILRNNELSESTSKLRVLVVLQHLFKLSQKNKSPNFMLLGCFAVISFGYALALWLIKFTFTDLFVVRRNYSDSFHLMTVDKYLVINYKAWKEGLYSSTNILFKVIHTMLVEIYTSSIFLLCIFMSGQNSFVSVVLYTAFCIAFVENLKKFKIVEQVKIHNGHQMIIRKSVITIEYIVWSLILMNQLKMVFDLSSDLFPDSIPEHGILVLWICMSVKDWAHTEAFYKTRQQLKEESNIKTKFSALCATYKYNNAKLFDRICAFKGKRRLDEMSKNLVMENDIQSVKIFPDYNKSQLEFRLDQIYQGLQKEYIKGIKLYKHKLMCFIYGFLIRKTNLFRQQDLFLLYEYVLDKNQRILEDTKELDLKLYFNGDFRQFEKVYKDSQFFYELYRERDEAKMQVYNEQMSAMVYSLNLNMGRKKKTGYEDNAQDIYQMNKYIWEKSETNKEGKDDMFDDTQKVKGDLKKASQVLFQEIGAKNAQKFGLASFENLKMDLRKKGFIVCKFGKQKIVLYNIKTNVVMETSGFNILIPKKILLMCLSAIASNLEIWCILTSIFFMTFYGGVTNIAILGVIFFCILPEEKLGHSQWWRVTYLLCLAKLVLKLTLVNKSPELIQLLLGSSTIFADVTMMILVNVVLYNQKKLGFSQKHFIELESPAAAMVRLVANRKLEDLTEQVVEEKLRAIEGLTNYLRATLKDQLSQENYWNLKFTCTRALVGAYMEIQNYKEKAFKTGVLLAKRIRDDIFKCTEENLSNFFFRNFSLYSRKTGKDYQGVIYFLILVLIAYSFKIVATLDTAGEFSLEQVFFNKNRQISSQVVITVLVYVIMLLVEKFFSSSNSKDLIGIRKDPIAKEFWRQVLDERKTGIDKKLMSPKEQLILKVKAIIHLQRVMKHFQVKKKTYFTSISFFKYVYLMFLWVLLHLDCFFIMPILKLKEKNKFMYQQNIQNAFYCNAEPSHRSSSKKDIFCSSYLTLGVSQIFYFLNCMLLFISIYQLRKGQLIRIPDSVDYKVMYNKIKTYLYYGIPGIREVCTFIEYASTATTLNFSEWMLCDDIKKSIVYAQITHNANNYKIAGRLFERKKRVGISLGFIIGLCSLLLLPMIIFTDISSGANVYEMCSGEIRLGLYDSMDKKLIDLFETNLLMENRALNLTERLEVSASGDPSFRNLDLDSVRLIKFGSYSQKYLRIDMSGRESIKRKLLDSLNSTVLIKIDIIFYVSDLTDFL